MKSRRPRTRSKSRTLDITMALSWVRVAKPEHWDAGLRRDLTLALIDAGHKDEIAAGMVRAYERRTPFMPRYRAGVRDSELLEELGASY